MSIRLLRRQALSRRASALAVALAVGTGGCQSDVPMPDPSNDGAISFSVQIQPILTTNCAGCHSPGGAADLEGIVLQLTADVSYDLLVGRPSVQRPDLTHVIPGDSSSSLLFLKVSTDSPPVGLRMPRFAPPLSQSEMDLIRDWIDEGALNN